MPLHRSMRQSITDGEGEGAEAPNHELRFIIDEAPARLTRGCRPRSCRRHRCFRARDRKSTRLNSSHANISYAVFCLKKKKNTKLQYAVSSPNAVMPQTITVYSATRQSSYRESHVAAGVLNAANRITVNVV